MSSKRSIPKIMELVFDIIYLLTALSLGTYFIAMRTTQLDILWGSMALVLAVGDAFHLVPRMISAVKGDTDRLISTMGVGKMLTSITMTVFYSILWICGLAIYSIELPILTAVMLLLSIVRIVLCLLPQNCWTEKSSSYSWGIYRNIPFAIQGAMVIWLFLKYSNSTIAAFEYMWIAVLLSFLFYLPVVLFSNKIPKLGMLMLPKSCAYIWIISMGISLIK